MKAVCCRFRVCLVTHHRNPYIEEGNAGIAKVAMRYGVWERMDAIRSDSWRKYGGSSRACCTGLGSFVDVLRDVHLFSGTSGSPWRWQSAPFPDFATSNCPLAVAG